jgi:glyoxylase-like metal-dependent hydrolase (beta-lactamase superfamily II)
MQTWTVGDLRITKVLELEEAVEGGIAGGILPDARPDLIRGMAWLHPDFATAEGRLKISVHALLVRGPGFNLVVDTCAGNGKERASPLFNMLQTAFLDEFAATGCAREDVDLVLCTHLHVDHVGWNTMRVGERWVPTFPNARYLIGAAEYERSAGGQGRPDTARLMADSVQPLLDAGLVDFVETDAVIAPGVSLFPAPGHTAGQVGVLLESQGARAVITGDLMHHPCQVAHPEWSSDFDADKDRSRLTRIDFVRRFAGDATLVIGTHFAGRTAGRIVQVGEAHRLD